MPDPILKTLFGLVLFLLSLLYIDMQSDTNITGNYQLRAWDGLQTITYDPWDFNPTGVSVIDPKVIKYDYNSKYIAVLSQPGYMTHDTYVYYRQYCEYYVIDVEHIKLLIL